MWLFLHPFFGVVLCKILSFINHNYDMTDWIDLGMVPVSTQSLTSTGLASSISATPLVPSSGALAFDKVE